MQGHQGSVSSVAVTNDNKYIISGSLDKTLRVWNIMQKEQVALLSFDENILNLKVDEKNNIHICFSNGVKEKIEFINIV